MPRAKVPKNLEIEGTSKLAARSKPSDKHERPDLNIEEATVASPRPSRKRAGDYFDFSGPEGEPSIKPADALVGKPKETAKAVVVDKEKALDKDEIKAAGSGRKSKRSQEAATEPADVEGSLDKKDKPKASKKRHAKPEADDGPSKAVKEPKAKPNKSKTASSKTAAKDQSSAISPDVAMDEGPFESLLAHGEGEGPADITEGLAKKVPKPSKRASKQAKEKTEHTITETSAVAKKSAKTGTEKARKAVAGSKGTVTETAIDLAEKAKKESHKGAEKAKKAVKPAKIPSRGTAAEVADTVVKEAKTAGEKVKQSVNTVESNAAKTTSDNADKIKENAKDRTEKTKKAAKSAKDNAADAAAGAMDRTWDQVESGAKQARKAAPIKDKGTAKNTDSKPESSKSKKRKAPEDEHVDAVKTNVLDPLSEHAEALTNKKQRKEKANAKSLGDAVSGLIGSTAEGATAARASLGNLASTLIGGATEAAESTARTAVETAQQGVTEVNKSAKAVAKKVKGKGKVIADDVAEALSKAAAPSASVDRGADGEEQDGEEQNGNEDSSDAEPDDQTAAILAGFESEGDYEEPSTSTTVFQEGQKVPELPDAETTAKKLKELEAAAGNEPGVVYVGRIPHGFYEHEMREYFSQFGDISRLRLSRNRKTGASKHWAFLEFKSDAVAKIVAETMNNYLMFGHILKCRVVPQEQLHEGVWKGANKRFKKIPWNKMERRKLEVPVSRAQWGERIEQEKKRREDKKEKLAAIGYEFEGGALKSIDDVPVRDTTKAIEEGESIEQEKSLVTAGGDEGTRPVIISEEIKTKKTKKRTEGEPKEVTTTVVKKTKRALEAGEDAAGALAKKVKKRTKQGE